MDQREVARIKIKFGKFLDPFAILAIIFIVSVSVLSVRSLTPRTFLAQDKTKVLGVKEEPQKMEFELIQGEHNYITSEKLEGITPDSFKYTAIIKPRKAGLISKPIIEVKHIDSLKTHLAYTNSTNLKISLVDKKNNTSYVLQELDQIYSPKVQLNQNSDSIYLLLQNEKSVFFNQYLEINFFLNP